MILRLKRDVAVRAVDDAACLKIPTVICHGFDCRLVFAGEGNAHKIVASVERPISNARHTAAYCQTR